MSYSPVDEPLVTILVVTYNSSDYVVETLDSARFQTYRNIELIVSDDCSTDRTVSVCSNWIEQHRSRFVNVELITYSWNTGIPANVNRGYQASKGEWIKPIAGDDALLSTCIEDNIAFVLKHPSVKIVYSIAQAYKDNFLSENFIRTINRSDMLNFSDRLTANDQYELLLRNSLVTAPTVFLSAQLIKMIGYCDESIPYIEDWPMWLKVTKAGEKIHFLNAPTVLYRIHVDSITNKDTNRFLCSKSSLNEWPIYTKYINNNVPVLERGLNLIIFYFIKVQLKYFNRNNRVNRLIYFGTPGSLLRLRECYVKNIVYPKIRKRIQMIE